MARSYKYPVTLIVTPNDGTSWVAADDDGLLASGGSPGRAKGARTDLLLDWTPAIRRAMRDCGVELNLDDAEVVPHGWSIGPGHAPQGVQVTWRVLR